MTTESATPAPFPGRRPGRQIVRAGVVHPSLLRVMRVTLPPELRRAARSGGAAHTRALQETVPPRRWCSCSALLATTYVLGTTGWRSRVAGGRANPARLRSTPVWLGSVTVLWIALALLSRDFAWVVFPLFFLYPVLLPRRWPWSASWCSPAWWCSPSCCTSLPGPSRHPWPSSRRRRGGGAGRYGYRALYRDARRHVSVIRQLESTRAELARRSAPRAPWPTDKAREIHEHPRAGTDLDRARLRAAQQAPVPGR
ncbi:hypothetical protein QJS66_06935 [Kocuria rhizophila]|nr:hypothetical protein QJS66_06935 [Kocuria rhizophila]